MMNAFESESEKVRKIHIVRVDIKDTDGNIVGNFELHVVCSPIAEQLIEIVQDMYSHLICLKLADSNDGDVNLDVQVLIGGYQYWDIVTENSIRVRWLRKHLLVGF